MRLIDADELLNVIKARAIMGESFTINDFERLIKTRQTLDETLDVWCSDCKDYDRENNRCLKYDRLVKKELTEMREMLKEKLK